MYNFMFFSSLGQQALCVHYLGVSQQFEILPIVWNTDSFSRLSVDHRFDYDIVGILQANDVMCKMQQNDDAFHSFTEGWWGVESAEMKRTLTVFTHMALGFVF